MTDTFSLNAGSSTGPEIQSALRALHQESVVSWAALDTRTFLAPIGDAWSPAGNVRHLTSRCTARPVPSDPDVARARIMDLHASSVATLCAAITRWPEPALDAHRLPHPLIGRLTVREMLLFTLYHNRHHLENVQRRFASAPTGTT